MLFNYNVINQTGAEETGSIDAVNIDIAINSLQRRGYVISSIVSADEGSFLKKLTSLTESVSSKDMMLLSNQISTLFSSHVSVLRIFRLLAEGNENAILEKKLNEIADDIQGGESLSGAMGKHPAVFSEFFVNMVKAGEESGKLSETFAYLAGYLERNHDIMTKTKNALVYPAFVVGAFIAVMILMLTFVIPKLSAVLIEAGQPIPMYTQMVINLSNFLINYGLFFLVFIAVAGVLLWKVGLPGGKQSWSAIKMNIPYFGTLFRKTYLSRISDNLQTLLSSGVPMLRSIEITARVVGDDLYTKMMMDVAEKVKSGSSLSDALGSHEAVPNIMVQMIRVGEETGELSTILQTLAKFYKRETDAAVDTLVGLIEPIMIILLAVGVGTLLASVLIPIYNITATIS
jgi:type IV pilus assembly protein PilC